MKRNILTMITLLLCLMMVFLSGCSVEKNESNSSLPESSAVEDTNITQEETVEETEKSAIDFFFDRCSALAEENGKTMRTSLDAWHVEETENSQVKYTSLGSTVVNTVLFDTEQEKVIFISSSSDPNSYADDAIRADMIFDAAVLAAAMTDGKSNTVGDFRSGFESVIESGVEMFQEDVKLSLSSDENISLTAELI